MMTTNLMSKQQFAIQAMKGWALQSMVELAQASGFLRQTYHAFAHPVNVYLAARRVLICLIGKARYLPDVENGLFCACMAHDIVQDATTGSNQGFNTRLRVRGPNEMNTAQMYIKQWQLLRELVGDDIISDEIIEGGYLGIQWTVPAWNPELKTVTQPGLWEGLQAGKWTVQDDMSITQAIAIALSMGDLAACGHKPQVFLADSGPLFVEENPGIDQYLRQASIVGTRDPQRDILSLDIMRKFDATQSPFAIGRMNAFEAEISYLPQTAQEALRNRINRFDESAQRAAWRAEDRANLDVLHYASAMGFQNVPTM